MVASRAEPSGVERFPTVSKADSGGARVDVAWWRRGWSPAARGEVGRCWGGVRLRRTELKTIERGREIG